MRRRVLVAALAAVFALTVVPPAFASSHREAPLISADPAADNTDVYAFRSFENTDTVTLIANWYPGQIPAGGPNFYRFADDAFYDINVYNNDDKLLDVKYRFRFKTRVANGDTFLNNTAPVPSLESTALNVTQTYSVTKFKGDKVEVVGDDIPVAPSNVGVKSMPDYDKIATEAVKPLKDKETVFAGQRDDPFYADVGGLFDLLTIRKPPGDEGGGVDGLAGHNVQSIAIQVPITELSEGGEIPTSTVDPRATIGVYASTRRMKTRVLRGGETSPSASESREETEQIDEAVKQIDPDDWVQVSRLGNPLVNEVVIPLAQKDQWNRGKPSEDGKYASRIEDPELAKLITQIYKIQTPTSPRADLMAILANGVDLRKLGIQFANVGGPRSADVLRLNMAVPSRRVGQPGYSRFGILGNDLAGFPNGRRLGDDVVDIEMRAMAGATPFTPQFNKAPNNQLGDGVDGNDKPVQPTFPYVPSPHPGSVEK